MDNHNLFLYNKRRMIKYITGILLFLAFTFNLFHSSPLQHFLSFQSDSQALVIGRLAYADKQGVFSRSGLMGFAHPIHEHADKNAFQYKIFVENLSVNDFESYNSHPGLQGIFYALLLKIIPLKGWNAIFFLQCLVSLFSAWIFGYWLRWVRRIHGEEAFWINLLFILGSSYIVLFARNLYWVLGMMYLPLLACLWWSERTSYQNKGTLKGLFLIMSCAALLKGLFGGFEYVSTTCLMGLLPLFYYGIRDEWPKNIFVKRIVTAAGAIGIANFFTAILLVFQLIPEKGSFRQAVAYLWYSFGKRSYGGVTNYTFDVQAEESLKSSLPEVLGYYFKLPVVDLSHLTSHQEFKQILTLPLYYFVILFATVTLYYLYRFTVKRVRSRVSLAAIVTLWLSILPSLSWLVVFKGHSYAHTHMNGIVWSMPFLLWGLASVVGYLSDDANKCESSKTVKV